MPVTLALCGICLLLACADDPLATMLAWQRDALAHGELWRLWTGHLVHFSTSHAGADVLALCALGLFAEPLAGSRRFAKALIAGAALVSLGMPACLPTLEEYRGASGLAALTATLAGSLAWQRHSRRRTLLTFAALALAAKIAWEACTQGAVLAGLPADVTVAWPTHLLGALAGCCAARFFSTPIHSHHP